MKRILIVALIACGSLAVLAAPVPKDKEAELPPPTEKQLQASKNNLKQIGIAIHSYNDANGKMPADVVNKDGKAILSWRVLLLPYLEEDALYKKFKLDEPWDSEINKPLIEKIPKMYAPIRVKAKIGETYYQGFNGADTTFETGQKLVIPRGFPDGTSNTIAVIEAGEPCIWSQPQDLPYDANQPLPKLGGLFNGDFHAVFMDASVHFGHSQTMKADEFRRLVTRNDGFVVDHDTALGTEKK
jgi:Protein of unknown function (DUF1559)